MMSRLHPNVFFALTAALVLFATAGLPQEEQRPQFRTEVEAVLVDVVVLDEQGQPVVGLTRENFEIYEDGFPQTIQSFDVIDFAPYVEEAVPGKEEKPEEVTPAPARPVSAATFPRRFIFILNRQGAQFDFLIRAKQALESFIVESMAEDDEAMVIDMAQSTRIIQQFSSSKETILRSVKKIPPLRADIFYGTRMATENVYDGLASLGDGLSPIPGRKVIIFMSPELIKGRDLSRELREAVASLNTSNATVYAVNIEGVDTIARTDEDRMDAVSRSRRDEHRGGHFSTSERPRQHRCGWSLPSGSRDRWALFSQHECLRARRSADRSGKPTLLPLDLHADQSSQLTIDIDGSKSGLTDPT